MKLTQDIFSYIEQHREEALDLLIKLGRIPAPSHKEEQRAAFCKAWLDQQGAQGVYVDEALNVVYPVGCTKENPLVVFSAHLDVVFPDTEELPLTIRDGRIYCPGIGDDTTNLVALLMVAKYIAQHELCLKNKGILLVANSCEEGLGNLKGMRKIFADYGSRVTEMISFDGSNCEISCRSVGSKRYRIEITTEGGHSYARFGNRNAISYLASLITTLDTIKVPSEGKTTFNVGTIKGGTSVNTIAQQAEMLYEIRSDCRESLAIMEQHLEAALAFYRTKGIGVHVERIGDRPCMGNVNMERQRALEERAGAAVRAYFGKEPFYKSASTDCNIPLSMGIPALALGCYTGLGTHTREECVDIDSLLNGLRLAFDLVLDYFEG